MNIATINRERILLSISIGGQAEYITPGSYSWTAPAGVTSVCVVCVGAGGGGISYPSGGSHFMHGGAGGGLGYINNYTVVPGDPYNITVGAGGNSAPYTGSASHGIDGGDSYFVSNVTVKGGGGLGGYYSIITPASTFIGDGGDNGGGSSGQNGQGAVGGGGAGGYSGAGGKGGNSGIPPVAGAGGGASGGNSNGSSTGYGGGGVGIMGEGTSGVYSNSSGKGGSGGADGGVNGVGGLYGGGGGGSNDGSTTNDGVGGAVRIIWGAGRAFPSTNTANV